MNEMRIYVASLSDYNNGRLEGKWLDLSDYSDASELMEAIQEMLDEITKKYNDGEVREEWAVHDYEGIPSTLASEYMGEQDFQQLYDIAEVADDRGIPVEVLVERAGDTGSDDYQALADSLMLVVDGNDESDIVSEYEFQLGSLGYDFWSNHIYIDDVTERVMYGEDVDRFREDILYENPDLDEDEAERQAEEMADEEAERREDLTTYLEYMGYEGEIPSFVSKDYEGAWKRSLSYDLDVIHHDGEMYVFSNNYSLGGTILSGMIGAYIGYKIGRAKPQKKGFETEKRIGRKIKGAFAKKKMAKGGSVENKGYDVIVKLPNGLTTKKDFDGFSKQEIIEWCQERGWEYNEKAEKLGGRVLKNYEFFVTPIKTYSKQLPKNQMAKGGSVEKLADLMTYTDYLDQGWDDPRKKSLEKSFFGKNIDVKIDLITEGEFELAIADELEKIKMLSKKVDFDEVRGEIDYGKTENNTDLEFYKNGKLVMTLKGDYNSDNESLDTIIDLDGETTELNYHPADGFGGVNLSTLKKNINDAFRELGIYSAVVSIEGYEEYSEDVKGLETAKQLIQDIKGNTKFQVLKGRSVGIGKRVDDSRVIDEFAKGGSTSKSDLDILIDEINEKSGGRFYLGGAYGNYELWGKDKDGGDHRIEVGSRKDIREALIKNRYNSKFTQYAKGGEVNDELYFAIVRNPSDKNYWKLGWSTSETSFRDTDGREYDKLYFAGSKNAKKYYLDDINYLKDLEEFTATSIRENGINFLLARELYNGYRYYIINLDDKSIFTESSNIDGIKQEIRRLTNGKNFYGKKGINFGEGGGIGFKGLSSKVAKRYEGKPVAPKYQSQYGKTYSKSEAKEVGDKVAGKVYWQQQGRKMEDGGGVKGLYTKYLITEYQLKDDKKITFEYDSYEDARIQFNNLIDKTLQEHRATREFNTYLITLEGYVEGKGYEYISDYEFEDKYNRDDEYAKGGGVTKYDYDYEDIGQFSVADSEWKNYSQEDFRRMGKKIVKEKYNGDLSRAYNSVVRKNKMERGGGVENNYNNPAKSTHVLHIDGQNWYLEKIDSTHFYMSNSPDYRGMAHHIGQHKGEPYYEEVREWLKSTFSEGGGVDSITPSLNKKVIERTKEIYRQKGGKSQMDFVLANNQAIKEFGYNPEKYHRKMNEIGAEFDESEYDPSEFAKGGGVGEFWVEINERTFNERLPYNLQMVNEDEDLISGNIWIKFRKSPMEMPSYAIKRAISEDFEYFGYGNQEPPKRVSLMDGSWGSFYIEVENLTLNEIKTLLLELPEQVEERLEERKIKGYKDLGLDTYGQSLDLRISQSSYDDNYEYAKGGGISGLDDLLRG